MTSAQCYRQYRRGRLFLYRVELLALRGKLSLKRTQVASLLANDDDMSRSVIMCNRV